MKKLLLLTASTLLLGTFATAQVSTCKNPCTKQKVVQEGAFIGVRVTNGPGCKNAQIMEVLPNTAAFANKLALGDIITTLDGKEIANTMELINLVATYQPGNVVKLGYIHLGKPTNKNIELGALRSRTVTEVTCCDDVTTKETVSNVKPNASFVISPNPASSNINIVANEILNGTATVNFYDLMGRQVYSVEANNNGYININVNVSGLKDGQYVVKLIGASKQYTQKLVIAK